MKTLKQFTGAILLGGLLVTPLVGNAADKKEEKAKPYTLEKCIVSDEKLGEMGKPYVFVHEGQEIKLCCKNCLKDFKKDTAKYLKKLKEAEAAKAKAKS